MVTIVAYLEFWNTRLIANMVDTFKTSIATCIEFITFFKCFNTWFYTNVLLRA